MPTALRVVRATAHAVFLRIYWGNDCKDGWIHNAMRFLRLDPYELVQHPDDPTFSYIKGPPDGPEDHPDRAEWPTACETCGRAVPAEGFLNTRVADGYPVPVYQVFGRVYYDDPPRPPRPGDVIPAPWTPDGWAVILPNGIDWHNGRASNCPHYAKGEAAPRDHRDWTVTGELPRITVRASIQAGDWHGFITDGVMAEA